MHDDQRLPQSLADQQEAEATSAIQHDTAFSSSSTRRFRGRNEPTRARDVFRHLSAWQEYYKTTTLYHDESAQPNQSPASCPDKNLVALAQLTALRLHAKSCLITLACSVREYVLADISQTTPLQPKTRLSVNTAAGIGTASFDRQRGFTGDAIEQWQKARRPRDLPLEPDMYYKQDLTQHFFMISDLRDDRRFRKKVIMERAPWVRFYCSVPIRSSQGSVIGSLTILDDRPRYGLSAAELMLMEDLSDTIFEHLHSVVIKDQQQRSQRMMQGLRLFNAGQSSMRDWWIMQEAASMSSKGRNAVQDTTQERNDAADAAVGFRSKHNNAVESDMQGRAEINSPPVIEQEAHPQQRHASQRLSTTTWQRSGKPALSVAPDILQATSPADIERISRAVYTRASNLLRESLNVDGVVIWKSNNSATEPAPGNESTQSNSGSDESTDASSEPQGNRHSCQVCSFSVRGSAEEAKTQSSATFEIRQAQMQRLMRLHPDGSIFHFEENGKAVFSSDDGGHGSSSSTQSGTSGPSSKVRSRLQQDIEALGSVVKGTRSAVLYPLVKNTGVRWRLCILAWSQTNKRILDEAGDLAFLRMFGHSLDAELVKLDTAAVDMAKTTFISSMSHELRSPLHGILAGAEFLHDTKLNAFQLEMANAISTAGKMLLDTVDHVLDYSKISTTTRASRLGRRRIDENLPSTDLASLTESIIETCVTAHRSQQSRDAQTHASDDQQDVQTSLKSDMPIAIILDISKKLQQPFKVHPGAWTRVVANLTNNALKYTKKGFISVRLELLQRSSLPSGKGGSTSMVQLSIEDTGIGMSKSFLENNVFLAFKQEDPHSSGTGLGLSIVRQIVQDMGATLSLESEPGKGTKFAVRLPVKHVNDLDHASSVRERSPAPRGKVDRFHLLSAAPWTKIESTSAGITQELVSRSVLKSAKEWLECDCSLGTLSTENLDTVQGDSAVVCAITEHTFSMLRNEDTSSASSMALRESLSRVSHILVLGDPIRPRSTSHHPDQLLPNMIYLQQPIGPLKLLRAITTCRDIPSGREENTDGAGLSTHTLRSSRTPFESKAPRATAQSDSEFDDTGHPPKNAAPGIMNTASSASPTTPALDNSGFEEDGPSMTGLSSIESEPEAAGRQQRNTVLIVEDNDINMKFLTVLLHRLKIPFECASHGGEAVEVYCRKAKSFFLVLMDMSMPVMDGFIATAKIREFELKHGLARCYVSALTGVTDRESRDHAFECGVDNFYSKPVRMTELKELLLKLWKE